MVNVYKILKHTSVEGPGTRFCIWTQGCKKHCQGCWAKDTWDFDKGFNYSVEELISMIKQEKEKIEGVTFLGGEPFEQATELAKLSEIIQQESLSVVCFTGYTLETLKQKNSPDINKFLANIDLLVDGGFEQDKFDLSRPWVGSSNQRYIFLTDRYSQKDLVGYKNKIELHIAEDGKVEINGMGDFKELNKDFCLQLGKNNVI